MVVFELWKIRTYDMYRRQDENSQNIWYGDQNEYFRENLKIEFSRDHNTILALGRKELKLDEIFWRYLRLP